MKLKLGTLCLLLALAGCSTSATKAPIPGSANQFDSSSYLTLVTTDSVIQSTKQGLAAGSFPASIAGNVKSSLNVLITAYDTANLSYRAYHAAAMAGTATTAQQNDVATKLGIVQTATTTLVTAKAGQ
jgi:hypothetical protein